MGLYLLSRSFWTLLGGEHSWRTCLQSLPFSPFISVHFWGLSVITRNSYLPGSTFSLFSVNITTFESNVQITYSSSIYSWQLAAASELTWEKSIVAQCALYPLSALCYLSWIWPSREILYDIHVVGVGAVVFRCFPIHGKHVVHSLST